VILVSHDQGAVEKFCNRAILLENGRVVADGKPREIYREYFNEMERLEAEKSHKPVRDIDDNMLRIDSVIVKGTDSIEDSIFTPRDATITVAMKVHALKNVPAPVYGIVIKRQVVDEAPVIVTNTHVLRKISPNMKAGEAATIEFVIDNVFGDGRYAVTCIAAETRPGGVYYDWKDDLTSFTVYDRPFNYVPLYINHSVKIAKSAR
jgi:ABC-type uncharacterized transport system ATPase subunit